MQSTNRLTATAACTVPLNARMRFLSQSVRTRQVGQNSFIVMTSYQIDESFVNESRENGVSLS